MEPITQLLNEVAAGRQASAEELLPLVYDELRRLAEQRLSHEAPGQTLQPTALVHEAWLRIAGADPARPNWDHRGHFFAAAAEAMRRILVDAARRKHALKRDGGTPVPLTDQFLADQDDEELLAVDEALDRLQEVDPDAAQLVKLRYFSGLTMAETAATLALPLRTVERKWQFAKAWLYREIREREGRGSCRAASSSGFWLNGSAGASPSRVNRKRPRILWRTRGPESAWVSGDLR